MKAVPEMETIRVPGDKSVSHRSLIISALADGPSVIRGLLRSADVASTATVLRSLGVTIEDDGDRVTVHGRGLRGLLESTLPLDCGNSGTSARLMMGVLAAHPFESTLCGDYSLSRRPMRRAAEPLERMGARFTFVGNDDGLPLIVHGADLSSVGFNSHTSSAQIKSAILLAAVTAQVGASVTEPGRSRDHTERMLAARGVPVLVDGDTVSVGVARKIEPLDMEVPGDPSSAAFFIALGAMMHGNGIALSHVCVNPTRTGFLDVVQRMGAVLAFDDFAEIGGEPTATIRLTGAATLRGVSVGGAELPSMIDEIPVLACLAARATGETVISDASELRAKESDRIGAVVRNLRAIGVDAEERRDGMVIRGTEQPLVGRIETHGDHRLAMAFGILGALPGNAIQVDLPDCVSVSYPDFWRDLHTFSAA
ncbi:MAG: 3-phosphoshikimate 1-carboxyvinyltransferase [Gemmatimonadota bacterium]|nr:3-phosphoshikimate 1-carboxyvinyltransferase [Gemmatimonadota bacterium]